jgi:hypothetical protein
MASCARLMAATAALLAAILAATLAAPGALRAQAAAQAGAPCAVCDAQRAVKCPYCGGSGTRKIRCPRCDGAGRFECPECEQPDAVGKAQATGRIRCPNPFCNKGKVEKPGGEKVTCKLCGGNGSFVCQRCSSGSIACTCGGRPVVAPCPECAGGGKLPCPACSTSAGAKECAFCNGRETRPCGVCARSAAGHTPCAACDGKGSLPCSACRGTCKLPCTQCAGTGIVSCREKPNGPERAASCPACAGKGFVTCGRCEHGRARCTRCKGGFVASACGCCDEGRLRCACTDSRGMVLAALAGVLIDEERYADALAYEERALAEIRKSFLSTTPSLSAVPKDASTRTQLPDGTADAVAKSIAAQAAFRKRLEVLTLAQRRIEREIADLKEWLPKGG